MTLKDLVSARGGYFNMLAEELGSDAVQLDTALATGLLPGIAAAGTSVFDNGRAATPAGRVQPKRSTAAYSGYVANPTLTAH
jgi:thiazole synthase ThiGH ThiG subunit